MIKERVGIEFLLEKIEKSTPKQKLETIKGMLKVYDDNCLKMGDHIQEVYTPTFKKEALKLKEEIESDNSVAYTRDWNWYYNADNVPNNDLVVKIRKHIETVRQVDFDDSLYFFNLLFRQKDELKDNLDTPIDYIEHLKKLQLNDAQKHILFGMLIYLHGGYPVNNSHAKYNVILRLVESEFLNQFPDLVTPEKQFCLVDQEFQTEFKELGKKISQSIQVLVSKGRVHNVEFSFGDLPLYVQNALRQYFDQKVISGTEHYLKWAEQVKTFIETIPTEIQPATLRKGIEYGQMLYNFYLEHECEDKDVSPFAQSWQRRLKLAEDMLTELDTQEPTNGELNIEKSLELNDSVMSKIDLIRLLNVLTEMRAFKNQDGTIPSKKQVMQTFGELLAVDVKLYSQDLNKALEKSEEANTKIFQVLGNKASQLWKEKNYK